MDLFDAKIISPMLIAEDKPAFDDENFIFELKLDGIRALAYLSPDGTELRNKRNKRLNTIYPELKNVHAQVRTRCILDGEIAVIKDGVPDFFEVQRRSLMSNPVKIGLLASKLPVSFTAYDILYQDGKELMSLPLTERKAILSEAVTETPLLNVSRWIERDGVALYNAAESRGLEGIVAKRRDSKYFPSKRTKDWIKCKNLLDEDFIVCGYFFKESSIASIILGAFQNGSIVYQSHISMGMPKRDFEIIAGQAKAQPYPGFPGFDNAIWVEPKLVCSVKFMERTPGGGLRQPVYKGLRDDKAPEECIDTKLEY